MILPYWFLIDSHVDFPVDPLSNSYWSLLMPYWAHNEFLLRSYWFHIVPIEFRLSSDCVPSISSWVPIEFLLSSYWFPIDFPSIPDWSPTRPVWIPRLIPDWFKIAFIYWFPIDPLFILYWFPIDALLMSSWSFIGSLLIPRWVLTWFLLISYWVPIDFRMVSYWFPIVFL